MTGVNRACRRTIKSDCFYPGASPSRWPLLTPRVWRASWESRSTPWIAVCEDRRHRVIGLDQFGHLTYRLLCIPPQGTVSAGDKPATLFCWHESVHFPRRLEAVSGREDCIWLCKTVFWRCLLYCDREKHGTHLLEVRRWVAQPPTAQTNKFDNGYYCSIPFPSKRIHGHFHHFILWFKYCLLSISIWNSGR